MMKNFFVALSLITLMTYQNFAMISTKNSLREHKPSFKRTLYTGIENAFFSAGIALVGYSFFKKIRELHAITQEHAHCKLRNAAHDLDLKKINVYLGAVSTVNDADRDGNTALLIATQQAHRDEKKSLAIIKALCHAGADINSKNKEGHCVLHYAIEAQATTIVQYLVHRWDLDSNAHDADGCTPFDLALALLEPPQTTSEILGILSTRLLRQALYANDYFSVENCIEHAQINSQDYQGNTLLMQACQAHAQGQNREEFIRLLARYGADFEQANKQGETPESFALSHNKYDLVAIICEAKKLAKQTK